MLQFKAYKMKVYLVSYIKKNGLIRDEEIIATNKQQAKTIAQYNFNPKIDEKIYAIEFSDFAYNYDFVPFIMSYIDFEDNRQNAIVYGNNFTESLLEVSDAIVDDVKEIVSFRRL